MAAWSTYSDKPRTKTRTRFYCHSVWSMYILESEERWPVNGSLNYYTLRQLELLGHRNGKAGTSLHSMWISHTEFSPLWELSHFGLPESQFWVCSLLKTEPVCLEAYVCEWKWNF